MLDVFFFSGLGQHYHIEEDIVRIPRKKTNSHSSPASTSVAHHRNSSSLGAEEAPVKLRATTSPAVALTAASTTATMTTVANSPIPTKANVHNNNHNPPTAPAANHVVDDIDEGIHDSDQNPLRGLARNNVETDNDDDDDESHDDEDEVDRNDDDDDDSYVNITLTRGDPIAEAMKVVELSGSVDDRRSDSIPADGKLMVFDWSVSLVMYVHIVLGK